jgi:hypothetical protein
MANREDASVQTVQPPGRHGSRNRAAGVAKQSQQLADRDDPVLPIRQNEQGNTLSHRAWLTFVPHNGSNGSAHRSLPRRSNGICGKGKRRREEPPGLAAPAALS